MTLIYPIIDIRSESISLVPSHDPSSINTSAESEQIQHLVIPESLVPAGTDLVITTDPSHCLMLYRLEVWQTFSRLLLNIPDAVTAISALKRVVIGNARCETIDEQHRLALAPDLSKFAGLGKTAYWVPIGNYVELWSPDSFDENVRGSFLRLLRQMAREEE